MQIVNRYSNRFQFFLYVIDAFSKNARDTSLKERSGEMITKAFQKSLKKWKCKPNNLLVHKLSELNKNLVEDNDFEIHSIHNEGKSVVTEELVRTLNNKIYKYMTPVSKTINIDKLPGIGKHIILMINQLKWNSTDVTAKHKLTLLPILIWKYLNLMLLTSKYNNVLLNGYRPNWTGEVLLIINTKCRRS